MSVFTIPSRDTFTGFSLGSQVSRWMESYLVHGPGDIRGEPYKLDREKRAVLLRLYEVQPPGAVTPEGRVIEGRRRFKRGAVSVRKGWAKCLAPETLVLMADGSQKRADEVVLGDSVVSENSTARVLATEEQPPADLVRITTASGRSITTTSEHPFLKRGTRGQYPSLSNRTSHKIVDEWVSADSLKPGDRLVPRLGHTGSISLPGDDAWIIGAIVGDGSGDGRFTNVDPDILDRIRLSYEITHCGGPDWYVRGIRPLLRQYGLFGCNSRSKRVPSDIMMGDRKTVASFLAGYLDTDGYVEPARVVWTSVNRDLLSDCQVLLAALGVNGRLKEVTTTYNSCPHQSWKLIVTGKDQVALLASVLPVAHSGKSQRLQKAALPGRCTSSLVSLDPVVSVESVGIGRSIAITVDGNHTHVTEGLVTHNTEVGAAITAAELHPSAPVRFSRWAEGGEESDWLWVNDEGEEVPYIYRKGEPIGVGVRDPYIPMVAYTEEQSEELAYGALCIMLGEGPLADDFDIGKDRILLVGEDGKAIGKAAPLASKPNSRDGARTSFQLFDESHRLDTPNLVEAHQTMQANIPKRYAADAWTLEITTSYEPGAMSVAEGTMEYARKVDSGKVRDSRLFFYHRQADQRHKVYSDSGEPDPDAMRAAVIEASGPASEWSDIDAIVELGLDPQTDRSYWERVWLNRPVQGEAQVFDLNVIDSQAVPGWVPPKGDMCVLGFDGARTRDATALVLTHLATARQSLLALWENTKQDPDWEVPSDEVEQAVEYAFTQWNIWRMYADPYRWETYVAEWVAKYMKKGKPRVFSWPTNTHKKMALSIKAYIASMRGGEWSYDGDRQMREHFANSRRNPIPILDEDGKNLFIMKKERPDSPFKIDAAMSGCLSWEAYRDALAAGVNLKGPSRVPVSF